MTIEMSNDQILEGAGTAEVYGQPRVRPPVSRGECQCGKAFGTNNAGSEGDAHKGDGKLQSSNEAAVGTKLGVSN